MWGGGGGGGGGVGSSGGGGGGRGGRGQGGDGGGGGGGVGDRAPGYYQYSFEQVLIANGPRYKYLRNRLQADSKWSLEWDISKYIIKYCKTNLFYIVKLSKQNNPP